jgi:hypothetical protein
MLVAASEGQGFRYEVVERTEGYLVRSRCLDSGAVDESDSKLFRTAAVAFRYAEMSASFDRYAAARMAGEDAGAELAELEAQQSLYAELSRRLRDDGMAAMVLEAWQRADEERDRRRFH